MANSPQLPLSNVVDVSVVVSQQLPATPTFNAGLVIGSSGVIPSVGANSRIRQYGAVAQMLADGFTAASGPDHERAISRAI